MLFIVYSGNNEAIITTEECDENTVQEYFTNAGRDLEDYDRNEIDDGAIHIVSEIRVK